MIPHPKLNPAAKLLALNYNVVKNPYLKFFKFDMCVQKSRDMSILLRQPAMIDDFAITQSHVIIPDEQVVFILSDMVQSGSSVIHGYFDIVSINKRSKNLRHYLTKGKLSPSLTFYHSNVGYPFYMIVFFVINVKVSTSPKYFLTVTSKIINGIFFTHFQFMLKW